ncbi:MAG: hypothetical protein Q9196_006781 [Gyalolechia fulgens]
MSLVDVGLPSKVSVSAAITPNTRVTVKLPENSSVLNTEQGSIVASAVAPSEPREDAGYYWGYGVRAASSLSTVITESTYQGGYDLTFDKNTIPEFSHMLIVFGGVAGLEVAVEADDELRKLGVNEPKDLFDYWVNLCPGQGSRTVRTEEAIWVGLTALRDVVMSKGRK